MNSSGSQKTPSLKKHYSRRLSSVISSGNVRIFKAAGDKMINNYKIIKPLGKGAFGTVYHAQDVNSKEMFAIKKMNKVEL
jgi:serine/threonine protein kinase